MITQITEAHNKEEWFKTLDAAIDRARSNDAVTHVAIIIVHGRDAKPSPHGPEHSLLPVEFIHNMGDNLSAAIFFNQTLAVMAINEQERDANEPRH